MMSGRHGIEDRNESGDDRDESRMLAGVLAALGAGLLWGLVFLMPLVLGEYPPIMLAAGRYTAFGVFALGLAWVDRASLSRLTRADWLEAMKLALVGNLLYFSALATAIQIAGAPVPTLIIGTLPVVIAVTANMLERRRREDGSQAQGVSWKGLFLPLIFIFAGLFAVHRGPVPEGSAISVAGSSQYVGWLLAGVALACWTWYPIRNSRWMRAHPVSMSRAWASVQGVMILPLALLTGLGFALWEMATGQGRGFDWPLGPRPDVFLAWAVLIGLGASWLGTLLWNKASQALPTALVGQLIVFETLAALLYAFIWYRRWPSLPEGVGIVLLIVGVLMGVNLFRPARAKTASLDNVAVNNKG